MDRARSALLLPVLLPALLPDLRPSIACHSARARGPRVALRTGVAERPGGCFIAAAGEPHRRPEGAGERRRHGHRDRGARQRAPDRSRPRSSTSTPRAHGPGPDQALRDRLRVPHRRRQGDGPRARHGRGSGVAPGRPLATAGRGASGRLGLEASTWTRAARDASGAGRRRRRRSAFRPPPEAREAHGGSIPRHTLPGRRHDRHRPPPCARVPQAQGRGRRTRGASARPGT